MKQKLIIMLSFTFIFQWAHAQDSGIDALLQMESAFTNIAESVTPSIVSITVYAKATAAELKSELKKKKSNWEIEDKIHVTGYTRIRNGSGLILSDDGYIVSCGHFLIDPKTLEIAEYIDVEIETLGYVRGRVVGLDPLLNLVLIKVELPNPAIPARLGDSEKLKIGHWVIALGDPPGPIKHFR